MKTLKNVYIFQCYPQHCCTCDGTHECIYEYVMDAEGGLRCYARLHEFAVLAHISSYQLRLTVSYCWHRNRHTLPYNNEQVPISTETMLFKPHVYAYTKDGCLLGRCPCSLLDSERRFRDAYYLHHKFESDIICPIISLNAISYSEDTHQHRITVKFGNVFRELRNSPSFNGAK